MTAAAPPLCYRFARFELQPDERRLLSAGAPVDVGPRAFDLLLALVERGGHLVTKDELLERVWPKVVVEENNLQVQVSALRKILGADAIATVPGRGYRFTLQLTPAGAESPLPALTPKYKLPQQLTTFIGREQEIAEIKKILTKTRLLTLLGVGGIGKTRLSLQLGAEVMDDYPDGVWFVELAPLADARLVPQAVASVLGVKEEAGRPVLEALVKYFNDRQLLLILDNCEHLVEACAGLTKQLLQSGPHLKVLASSREPLHVAGETSYQVPALAVPGPQEKAVAALTQYEAVRLFIDRAVAVQSAFQVTEQNAAAVSEICRRLDGIPLALELAAARVRALSVENLDEHLSDRFRLLTGGDRTALPRQQTLRAMIDWSYELLSEPERIVFRRLAVFAGGWTLEAAEAVAAGRAIDKSDVLDILSRLVEKSLVSLNHQGERYALLETIKHYAQERLADSGEEDEVRTRHLQCYLALVEDENYDAEDANWFTRLDLELENLLSAHAWCDRTPRGGALGLRLVPRLRSYWLHRGLMGLGHQVTADALARPGTQERNLERSQALADAGALSYFMGRYAEVQAYLEESVSIAREVGDKYQAADSLSQMGRLFMWRGDLVTARVCAEEGLVLARELGAAPMLARSLNRLGELCRAEGNPAGAELFYEEALAFNRQRGGKGTTAGLLANLAITAIGRSDGDRARLLLLEGITMAEQIGSKWRACGLLDVCSGLAAHLQEFEHAARLYGSTEAQHEQIGSPREPVDDAFIAPLIARTRETLGAAAFATAEAAGRALSYEDALAEARAWLKKPS